MSTAIVRMAITHRAAPPPANATVLEPFVIGATCAWCLASAVLMDAALLLATASTLSAPSAARSSAMKASV